jgi:SAM-dependent methyltransferase
MTANKTLLGGLMTRMHEPIYARRLKTLADTITHHLRPNDRVLDVGCGNGTLGNALLKHPTAPRGLAVEGLERFKRGGEPILVHPYDGVTVPFAPKSYDVVIVADVLHHEEMPERLLQQCIQLSRRLVVIKDHQLSGVLSKARVSLIDWAANAPYGVKCLYRYNTPEEWSAVPKRYGCTVVEEQRSMQLYPPLVNLLFGRGLQYLVVLGTPPSPNC